MDFQALVDKANLRDRIVSTARKKTVKKLKEKSDKEEPSFYQEWEFKTYELNSRD